VFISDQVLATQVERVLLEYRELASSLVLHTSVISRNVAAKVRERIAELECLRTSPVRSEIAAEDRALIAKRLRTDLRVLKRTWMRFLVTEARLAQRGQKHLLEVPTFAA